MNHVILAFAAAAAFLVPATPGDTPPAADHFVIEAGEHPLVAVIDSAAEFLGHNYLVEEQFTDQLGSVRLHNRLDLDRAGCEDVLSQLLYTRGFAIVPLSREHGLHEVIFLAGPRRGEVAGRAASMTVEEVLRRRDRYVAVMTAVRLGHMHAPMAANALRPFFAAQQSHGSFTLTVGMAGDERTLLLQGFAPQVAAAIDVLHRADAEPPKATGERLDELFQRLDELEKRAGSARGQPR